MESQTHVSTRKCCKCGKGEEVGAPPHKPFCTTKCTKCTHTTKCTRCARAEQAVGGHLRNGTTNPFEIDEDQIVFTTKTTRPKSSLPIKVLGTLTNMDSGESEVAEVVLREATAAEAAIILGEQGETAMQQSQSTDV
jgi:hypothetical protein